jgi:hypothetical protein
LLLFLEKEELKPSTSLNLFWKLSLVSFWEVGFAENWVTNLFREAEQMLFASFSGKRRTQAPN